MPMPKIRPHLSLLALFVLTAGLARAAESSLNEDFEAEKPAGWTAFGEGVKNLELDGTTAASGRQSLRLTYAARESGGAQGPVVELNQTEPEAVLLEAAAQQESPGSEPAGYTFGLSLQITYADGSRKWDSGLKTWFDPQKTGWQKVSFIWLPEKAVKSVQPRLMYNRAGQVWFDAVHLATLNQAALADPNQKWGEIRPVHETTDFPGNQLPEFLESHIGQWQVADGELRTSGPRPEAGWYLRSRYEYRLDEVNLRLRKDEAGGIIYLHTRAWRILLRPGELMVKLTESPDWWASCARPIAFADTQWHTLHLAFRPDRLEFAWDGQELPAWTGPAQEFAGRPYVELVKDRRLPFVNYNEIFILHPYGTGARFSHLDLRGVQTRPATGFIDREHFRYPQQFVKDNAFERLAPREPVTVDWEAPQPDAHTAELPAGAGWEIPRPYAGDRQPAGVHFADYYVGWPKTPAFPGGLYHPRYDAPVEVKIHFKLAQPGEYTLQIPLGAMKNLANLLEVEADGRVVSREVYRGLNSSSNIGEEGVKDYVPLRFARAGYHRLTLRYSAALLDAIDKKASLPPAGKWAYQSGWFWKFGTLGFGGEGVRLVPGRQEPEWTFSAKKPQAENAFATPAGETEWFGKILHAEVTDLPDGPAVLRLGFQETVLELPGERRMQIAVNGRTVAETFDIVKEAGSDLTYITRDFPAEIKNGQLEFTLTGLNFQACLNYFEVRRGEQVLFKRNAGWHPLFANWGYRARPDDRRSRAFHADARLDEVDENYPFVGHNLAANPSFTLADADSRPQHWVSVTELRRDKRGFYFDLPADQPPAYAGEGRYVQDRAVYRSAPASLRVENIKAQLGLVTSFPVVDAAKHQEFSIWAKAQGAKGRARLAIWFYAQDYFSAKYGGQPLRYLGRTVSESALSGNADWTRLSVRAQPPFGAALAALVIEAEGEGTFWFDDAEFDGYGAEDLEITCSHLGFHPAGLKRFLIKSRRPEAVTYQVTGSGAPLTGAAVPLGFGQYPDRYYFRVELPELNREGDYKLTVQQGELQASQNFRLGRDVYRQLTQTLLAGITVKQFNTEVPGFHEPTHLDDYAIWEQVCPRFDKQVKVFPRTRTVLGGFHDAGDRIRHWDLAPALLQGTLNVAEILPGLAPELAAAGEHLAQSGFDCQRLAQLPDGHFFYADKPYTYDSIPGFGIERYIRMRWASPQMGGLFARAANYWRAKDAPRSATYAQSAQLTYAAMLRTWHDQSLGNESTPANRLSLAPKQIFGAQELFALTGRPEYAAQLTAAAEDYARLILAGTHLTPEYRHLDQHSSALNTNSPLSLDILWAPVLFLEASPDHPAAPAVRAAVRRLADDIARLSAEEPWGQALDLEPAGQTPARWPSDRSTNYWNMLAFGLARAGMLLDAPDLVRLAERQLQWNLGHNPYDICLVHGVGERFVAGGDMFYQEPEFYRAQVASGRKLWYFPGNTPTMGFRQAESGKDWVRPGRGEWGALSGFPRGYCPMFLQADYPTDPGPSEYEQVFSGNFASAAAALTAALDWLEKKEKH